MSDEYRMGEVIVIFKDEVSGKAAKEFIQELKLSVIRRIPDDELVFLVSVPMGKEEEYVEGVFRKNKLVEAAYLNTVGHLLDRIKTPPRGRDRRN